VLDLLQLNVLCRWECSMRRCTVRKILNFVMSVFPSARMEQLGSHWKVFHEVLCFIILRKQSNPSSIKICLITDTLYLTQFFLERATFQTHVVVKMKKTHFVFNNLFFSNVCRLWGNVEKYGITRQTHMKLQCSVEKLRFAWRITTAKSANTRL